MTVEANDDRAPRPVARMRLQERLRAPLVDPFVRAAPRDVRLNEDQWLVVGAAAVLGVVLLVIVVTAVVD